jgi:hypothetical protein
MSIKLFINNQEITDGEVRVITGATPAPTPVPTPTPTPVPTPTPSPVNPSITLLNNLQWQRAFYLASGQARYFCFNAATSSELDVMMESADTVHNYNADMIVKYVGINRNDLLIPTMDDYNTLMARQHGGITNNILINGYHYYINHASNSYETIAIPNNATGWYYIMLFYPNVGTPNVMLNVGVGW